MEKTPVDIKTLIKTSDINVYDNAKLIDKLKEHFSEEEQRLYVSNVFLYLNYHPVDDFVVDLDNVWKFIGFSNKANGKRLLKQHFTENRDYKISLIRTDEQVVNIKNGKRLLKQHFTENRDYKISLIRTDEQVVNIKNGKRLLKQHFTENRDYKISLIRTDEQVVNIKNGKRLLKQHFTENRDYKISLIRTDEQVVNIKNGKNIGGAGLNQETIMLNINTFKKLCLKSNTENADRIHDYYIKLEMVYNELMKEQLKEQQNKLEEQKTLVEEQKTMIKEKEELLLEQNKEINKYKEKIYEEVEKRGLPTVRHLLHNVT